ncbi:50S ribosome-binding GTPase [Candidatus Venteria ishoeyi]|uniref:GTPase family protein n=1 Tax=Candidatus Venteria ishoeyi TaxID=1899563 RepID=UPI0025A659DC|nr:GTPase [Candidatus Venteria ishoeyi]MDM8547999.1 50S ribosome-binding GTPase [Candidatus Venteria ishoeyi]
MTNADDEPKETNAAQAESWYQKLPGFWQDLARQVLSPSVESEENEQILHDLNQKLPIPVIWLLGKTQSGKSSIISALTGREDAEIGQGFKACTRTAQLYEFPSSQDCLLKFLDTRGLGEVAYNPAEDLLQFQEQAHILMVVLRAMDHNQDEVLTALREIRKIHSQWPVVVVQTTLHEAYPDADFEHLQPYPFNDVLDNPLIPDDLCRSLQMQRKWFEGQDGISFVVVDLTHEEENYYPANYGAEALWDVLLDDALPQGMQNIFHLLRDARKNQYATTAHPHIISYALMTAAAEAVPIPMISVPVVLSIQTKMFQSLASIYEQEFTYERFAEIAALLGSSYLLRLGGRQLLKLIPIYGQAVTAVYSGATTYALGHMLCQYFEDLSQGKVMSQAEFEQKFANDLERGKQFIKDMWKQDQEKKK